MKLAAITCCLCKYKAKNNHTRNNKLFKKSNKCFYNSLRSSSDAVNDPMTKDEITNFWTKLFNKTAKHNKEAAWLQVEEESAQHVQQQQWTNITVEEMSQTVRKLTNWKTPGWTKCRTTGTNICQRCTKGYVMH
eukprot:1481034-Ditylum_brightwellii.AAC.1